jgi:DNA-binding NtrC family response regulator
MNRPRLLIVHPDPHVAAMLASMLGTLRCAIDEVADDRAAVRRLGPGVASLIARVDLADPDALELLIYARRKHPEMPVILLSSDLSPDPVREALRLGAAVVLRFPPTADELRAAVARALAHPASPVAAPGHVAPREGSGSLPGAVPARGGPWGNGSPPSSPGRPRTPGRPAEVPALRDGPEPVLCCRCRATGAEDQAPARDDVPPVPSGSPGDAPPGPAGIRPLKEALEALERQLILQALSTLKGNRQETARALDIDRTTLFKKMGKYGLLAGRRAHKEEAHAMERGDAFETAFGRLVGQAFPPDGGPGRNA